MADAMKRAEAGYPHAFEGEPFSVAVTNGRTVKANRKLRKPTRRWRLRRWWHVRNKRSDATDRR